MKTSYSDVDGEKPVIPDHEMLRVIGRGSYGLVWLARAVTGALRAVKVVRRADFEYDRTFEREFEGIKKYEPISRDHPGLVAILHVGRNLTAGFYYYVMELADDRLTGKEIHPELYVPRTLSTDIKKAGRLKMDACLDCGAMMADALHHMHSCGLSHRDVKPSNVIFVDGIPKLADIGLVAASGQRTFVGTEGFVPPEGPGSPQADIYSLGMVLYEMSTGKDRMEFPEVPAEFSDDSERKKWRQLNEVVCKACATSPKQRFTTSREMRHALERVKSLRFKAMPLWQRAFRMVLVSGLLALLITLGRNLPLFEALQVSQNVVDQDVREVIAARTPPPVVPSLIANNGTTPEPSPPEPPVDPAPPKLVASNVKVVSTPEGAKVFANNEFWGLTNCTRKNVTPGEIEFVVELEGYKTLKFLKTIDLAPMVVVEAGTFEPWRQPVRGEIWENSLGMKFRYVKERHVAVRAVSDEEFEDFMADIEQTFPVHTAEITSDNPIIDTVAPVVLVAREVATRYCDWLTMRERALGYLSDAQKYELNREVHYSPKNVVFSPDGSVNDGIAIFCSVAEESMGTVKITSEPKGAAVYLDEIYLGTTPLELPQNPGLLRFFVKAPGYKRQMLELKVAGEELVEKNVRLEPSNEAIFGKPWVNGLGMRFVPQGGILMGAWEVRVRDFEAYIEDQGIERYHLAPFEQGLDHPVVNISCEDARAFCEWLTEHERQMELIGPDDRYRLPSDLEWSEAAGLTGEGGTTPASRDTMNTNQYPWGKTWPPPTRSGNFADRAAIGQLGRLKIMTNYDDGVVFTADVGSFEPTGNGVYDLAGNVWEWIDDPYGGSSASDWAVARGGCYSSFQVDDLLSSCRNPLKSDYRGVLYGFRCVLVHDDPLNPNN